MELGYSDEVNGWIDLISVIPTQYYDVLRKNAIFLCPGILALIGLQWRRSVQQKYCYWANNCTTIMILYV